MHRDDSSSAVCCERGRYEEPSRQGVEDRSCARRGSERRERAWCQAFGFTFLREEAAGDAEPLPSSTTDANGKFQLEIDRDELDHGVPPSLLAIDKSQRIGWAAGYTWIRFFRVAKSWQILVELEQPIKLLEVRESYGHCRQ